MSSYIFRNYTVELFFDNNSFFSGYGDISVPEKEYDEYVIFYQFNPTATPETQVLEIEGLKTKIEIILDQLNNKKRIYIFTLKDSVKSWSTKQNFLQSAIRDFNNVFLANLVNVKNVVVINIDSFFEEIYDVPHTDHRFFFISHIPINPQIADKFKEWFEIQRNAINLVRKKCIVLDCDNTLWGGIIGEEGINEIKLNDNYPGICYKKFQELLVEAGKKGILLAVCSKNNEQDVFEVWNKHPSNLLNKKNIVAYRIDWNSKVSNIESLAAELNIGLDSIVFIDDNPLERNQVHQNLPLVTVPHFPKQPYELVNFFWSIYNKYFISYDFTDEDLKKTEQYKENFNRQEVKKKFVDINDYLKSLQIEIDIFVSSDLYFSRIAQLTQKTNQFNLTTKRYKIESIKEMVSEGATVFCAGIKDKFGDNGITVSGIIKVLNNQEIEIDSYLLSCRILGLHIEFVTLQSILNVFFKKGVKSVRAKYIPTAKNIQVVDFYDKLGFKTVKIDKQGIKYYQFEQKSFFEIEDFYKIKMHGI
jgi:FkbH-like protein